MPKQTHSIWLCYIAAYLLIAGVVAESSSSSNLPPANKWYESNTFDTYNADKCKRVRRAWSSLTDTEKQSYVDAMLKLREVGGGDLNKDDLVAVASEHMDANGELQHRASTSFFWHGYLLWEMESRIRSLGGDYECFGMPYWDWTTESSSSRASSSSTSSTLLIFDNTVNHLGGTGNAGDAYTVNEYSWPGVSVRDYWVPTHCTAKHDEFPFCSLKRSTSTAAMANWLDAQQLGRGIIDNAEFAQFARWYGDAVNLPHDLLTYDETLSTPVVTSFDPIWYLFHSMMSYHQAIWQDCHGFDEIAPADLDQVEAAYSPYCDNSWCGDMALDGPFNYGGMLHGKSWSFVHDQELTVRKSYHQPRWNVLYDLGDGLGFFTDSGLKEFCAGKLNENWFVLQMDGGEEEEEWMEKEEYLETTGVFNSSIEWLAVVAVVFAAFGVWCLRTKSTKLAVDIDRVANAQSYGAV